MHQEALVDLDAAASTASAWPEEALREASLEGPAPGAPVALALIGGPRLVRDAAAALLAAQQGMRVLGSFESAAHYLAVAAGETPDLLLLDGDAPAPGACQAAVAALTPPHVGARIVLLCRELREEVVCCAIEARVSGLLLKSYTTAELCTSIRYIAMGRTVMPAGWQRAIVPPPRERLALSPRHRQILALIADGRCNEEIAAELDVSPNTIKFHIRALYARLGVRNRVEAANKYAQLSGGEA